MLKFSGLWFVISPEWKLRFPKWARPASANLELLWLHFLTEAFQYQHAPDEAVNRTYNYFRNIWRFFNTDLFRNDTNQPRKALSISWLASFSSNSTVLYDKATRERERATGSQERKGAWNKVFSVISGAYLTRNSPSMKFQSWQPQALVERQFESRREFLSIDILSCLFSWDGCH